ncbi:MAG: hypothetical protein V1936_02035 [Patescibacteria group bacterium]
MKVKIESKFSVLQNFLNQLHDRLFFAYSCFEIWESFKEMLAPNKIGKDEAVKNLKTINRFNYFFLPTQEAHRKIFSLELSKFFDLDRNSLSIVKILDFTQQNLKQLTIKEFKEFNQGREHLENLAKNYEGIQSKDLEECEKILFENGLNTKEKDREKRIEKGSLIWKLKKFRNQYLAHDQIKKEKIPLSVYDINNLFRLSGKILNLLSYKSNHNSTWHFSGNDNVKRHTNLVVQKLRG